MNVQMSVKLVAHELGMSAAVHLIAFATSGPSELATLAVLLPIHLSHHQAELEITLPGWCEREMAWDFHVHVVLVPLGHPHDAPVATERSGR